MSTTAYYHPRGMDIDFRSDRLPSWLYNEIASLHGQISRDDNPPKLTCRGNGEPLLVYKTMGRYFVRHFPHGNPDGHDHGLLRRMSDAHRWQAEYGMRAAQAAGLDAHLEVSTGHKTRPRRMDVGIHGPVRRIGLEIQRSNLTAPRAKRRAADQFDAGWTSAWLSDQENDPPWTDKVPTGRLSVRGWDCLPPANTANVIITRLYRVRNASRPSGWWYEREPVTVLYDELAYLMPVGDIIPVTIGTRGDVVLAEKAAAEVIDSCTYPGASVWDPRPKMDVEVREASQRKSLRCHHETNGTIATLSRRLPDIMLRPLREPPAMPEPVASPPISDSAPLCIYCSAVLLAPISIFRRHCERCKLDRSWVAS